MRNSLAMYINRNACILQAFLFIIEYCNYIRVKTELQVIGEEPVKITV